MDPRSWTIALVCSIAVLAGGILSFEILRLGVGLAAIWLPAALTCGAIVRFQPRNPVPLLAGSCAAIFAAASWAGWPMLLAAGWAGAHIAEVWVITVLLRRVLSVPLDMQRTDHLFMLGGIAGLLGPFASTVLAAGAFALAGAPARFDAAHWFAVHSVSMMLVLPAIVLLANAHRGEDREGARLLVKPGIMLAGLGLCALIVMQNHYPALFLVLPITLFCALRLGSVWTALFLVALTALMIGATLSGIGPIASAALTVPEKTYLLSAFLAANLISGLPVAAILAGRERKVEALTSHESLFEMLANNISDVVMRYDMSGICTYVSPCAREVLGEAPQTFLGQRASDRMHPEARELILAAEQRLISGRSSKERFTYRRFLDDERGKPVFLEASCSVIRTLGQGDPQSIMVSVRDVTERVELERLLTHARQHAEEATRAKSEFLANMSHEIRTPMNGVLGFAELMLQSELTPDQRRQADLIVQSGHSMMALLNDILDLSKIESGQMQITQESVELIDLLEECAQLHRASAEAKGLRIAVKSEMHRLYTTSDAQKVRQIILNLVGNAVKFTHEGEVAIVCDLREDLIKITVRDTGIGIPEDAVKKIFDPFSQAANDTSKSFGGTGLGLSICRELAEMLDGYISVESEIGIGTRFLLTLPYIPAEPAPKRARKKQALDLSQPAHLPPASHILLVEDHDINRTLVCTMLERCGQRVSIAHDGQEAIAKVLQAHMNDALYDLVLMDIQMPGCDGYEATRVIRAEGLKSDRLPIIALSANAFPEDITASRNAGMQAHIAKPLVFSELIEVLQRWLPTRIVEAAPGLHADAGAPRGLARPPQPEPVSLCASVSQEAEETGARLEEDFRSVLNGSEKQPSQALQTRWRERRSEALDAVRGALREGQLTGQESEALVRMVHNLAGTAALFGEEDLGAKAAAFERALKSGVGSEVRERLARDLLDAA